MPQGSQRRLTAFTPEQRLFIGWGQIWCQNETDQMARLLALNNEHSPGKYRANGVVQNMPEFQKAWDAKLDSRWFGQMPATYGDLR